MGLRKNGKPIQIDITIEEMALGDTANYLFFNNGVSVIGGD